MTGKIQDKNLNKSSGDKFSSSSQSSTINPGNFIELKYTGRVKDGNIFDTNVEEDAKKMDLDIKSKPLVICIGQHMILPAIDKFLIGKEIGKDYKLELAPEEAFGKREREAIRTIPLSVFHKANLHPEVGKVFTFDNYMGKVSAVSGGRVIVDFNNPIAGKEVVYDLHVKAKVENIEDKARALAFFLFRQEFKLEVKEKKLLIEAPKGMGHIISMFQEKFKEILHMDIEVTEIEGKEEKHDHHHHEHEHSH